MKEAWQVQLRSTRLSASVRNPPPLSRSPHRYSESLDGAGIPAAMQDAYMHCERARRYVAPVLQKDRQAKAPERQLLPRNATASDPDAHHQSANEHHSETQQSAVRPIAAI